ncbi:MAG: hypothetical protein JNJ44_01060 [Zoogloeaceae bacterium]|nr:hypothetical protein [Zoogloeaceae bacterium]
MTTGLFPRTVVVGTSRTMMAGLMAGHFFLALGFALSGLAAAAKAVGLVVIGVSMVRTGGRGWSGRQSTLLLREDGTAELATGKRPGREIRIGAGTRDLAWVISLEYRWEPLPGSSRRAWSQYLLCVEDALDAESWRVLRIWLRFCVVEKPADQFSPQDL